MTTYRCVATSVAGFIQQLAVSYFGHGYWFYVTGRIPDDKPASLVDAKLVQRYGINISKWQRARRKRLGLANVQYLRHGRFFVLAATHGRHAFFDLEGSRIRDARRSPLHFAGYSVSHRGGHPHVRLSLSTYLSLKAGLMDGANHPEPGKVKAILYLAAPLPYAPVRRQQLNLLRAVNRHRVSLGLVPLPASVLDFRFRRSGPLVASPPASLPLERQQQPSTTVDGPPAPSSAPQLAQQLIEATCGALPARPAPPCKLRDVDATVARLAVVHPGLRPGETLSQVPLGEPRTLADGA